MSYRFLGDDETDGQIDAQILAVVHKIRKQQEEAERFRKLSFLATVGGALFAAVRLGILFAPKIRRRKVQEALAE
jgi:hypothetical protein